MQCAEPFHRPERPVRCEEQSDRVLQGVLRYRRQWSTRNRPDCAHDERGNPGGGGRDRHVPCVEPERDHDEHDLDALKEYALERHHEAEPVQPQPPLPGRGPAGGRLLPELVVLVVTCLEPRGPQDRLAQPLQPEDQQQNPHDQLQSRPWQPSGQGVPDDRRERAQRHERRRSAGEGRTPTAGEPHRQHDGQCLDQLDERRDERRDDQPPQPRPCAARR